MGQSQAQSEGGMWQLQCYQGLSLTNTNNKNILRLLTYLIYMCCLKNINVQEMLWKVVSWSKLTWTRFPVAVYFFIRFHHQKSLASPTCAYWLSVISFSWIFVILKLTIWNWNSLVFFRFEHVIKTFSCKHG